LIIAKNFKKDQPKMKLDLPPGGFVIFTPLFFLL